jgi:hypothetical protein
MKRRNTEQTDYCCPCCFEQLTQAFGNQLNPGNEKYGVMLYCEKGDPTGRTHPQEVAGHGKTVKDAYDVILAKFTGAKYEVTTEAETE